MDDKEHSWHDFNLPRLTVIPWLIWAAVVGLAIGLTLYASKVHATPLFQAEAGGVKIVLTDEECRLPAVENLKKKAFWHENGKVIEGCFGAHPQFPVILAYFADKTVVVLPVQIFVKVTGA